MDTLAEDAEIDQEMGVMSEELRIAVSEWVDDVLTFAIGCEQYNYTLDCINAFAVKHKLKWGREKCDVIEVGADEPSRAKWNLGKLEIDSRTE